VGPSNVIGTYSSPGTTSQGSAGTVSSSTSGIIRKTLAAVGVGQGQTLACGQKPTQISSIHATVQTAVQTVSSLGGQQHPIPRGLSVLFPSSVLSQYTPNTCLQVSASVSSGSAYHQQPSDPRLFVSGQVQSVTVYSQGSNTPVEIISSTPSGRDQQGQIQLEFGFNNTFDLSGTVCMYYNETLGEWSSEGVEGPFDYSSSSSDYYYEGGTRVTCYASHLTDFSVLLTSEGVLGQGSSDSETAIIGWLSLAFFATAIIVVTTIIIIRNRQITKKHMEAGL